ncbi:MAG: HupE/UreJ family protein [Spongiibacteraceae bacterium]|nr:HupE/UreJ family protein [Spongiibacteraceae bacterium]
MNNKKSQWMLIIFLLFCSQHSFSHDTGLVSVALTLDNDTPTTLSTELDVLDLALAVGLDNNADGKIQWHEYEYHRNDIFQYINTAVTLSVQGKACTMTPTPSASGVRKGSTTVIVTEFSLSCPITSDTLVINQQLLTNIDPSARVLLSLSGSGADSSMVLEPGETRINIVHTQLIPSISTFIRQGFHHLIIGYDHMAFLLLLLLPVAREGNFRQRFLAITGIVTTFTLAHSVTLSLSTTGLLTLPTKPVEVIIAASIVFTGLVNLLKPQHRMGWLLAYAFGLVHGFGFASALSELQITQSLRVLNLAAFNIGVELGQLAVIAVILPVIAVLGSKVHYSCYVVRSLSVVIAGIGGFWLAERLL